MAMGRALALTATAFQQAFQRGGGSRVYKYGVAEDLRAEAGFSETEIDGAREITERRRAAARAAIV